MKVHKPAKPVKQFAFWPYDQFPYVLGALGELQDNGMFKPDGYGGSTFRPIRVYHGKAAWTEAQKLWAQIIRLKGERVETLLSVNAGFRARLSALASFCTSEPDMARPVLVVDPAHRITYKAKCKKR